MIPIVVVSSFHDDDEEGREMLSIKKKLGRTVIAGGGRTTTTSLLSTETTTSTTTLNNSPMKQERATTRNAQVRSTAIGSIATTNHNNNNNNKNNNIIFGDIHRRLIRRQVGQKSKMFIHDDEFDELLNKIELSSLSSSSLLPIPDICDGDGDDNDNDNFSYNVPPSTIIRSPPPVISNILNMERLGRLCSNVFSAPYYALPGCYYNSSGGGGDGDSDSRTIGDHHVATIMETTDSNTITESRRQRGQYQQQRGQRQQYQQQRRQSSSFGEIYFSPGPMRYYVIPDVDEVILGEEDNNDDDYYIDELSS